jgi:hypothetical protein
MPAAAYSSVTLSPHFMQNVASGAMGVPHFGQVDGVVEPSEGAPAAADRPQQILVNSHSRGKDAV